MAVPGKRKGLLLEHANVITLDPNRPRAEAVLCRNGVIEAVGSNEEMEGLLVEGDTRFDCGELTLIPGFIDSHSHFAAMGVSSLRVQLAEVDGRDALLQVLRERAGGTPEGGWVVGVQFDETRWTGDRALPTREELDTQVSDRHPVVARRVCGHIAVANTLAIQRIGAGWEQVDPETGLLLEDVVLRLNEAMGVSVEEVRRGIEFATRIAYRHGVTTVVDLADMRTLSTYMDMEAEGALGLRVLCAVQARDLDLPEARGMNPRRDFRDHLLKLAGVKAFLDGSLGARTAALSEPYTDDPADTENRGTLLMSPGELEDLVARVEGLGLQLFMHAIGDRAIEAALDAIEARAAAGNPLRHRLEHMEVATQEQLDRMKDLRVIASMQPNFIVEWAGPGGMNEQRLGRERARASEALRDVWSRGIPLAFGSDVMPFGPLHGLEGAIHHPVEEQSLPPVVAIRAYTEGAAYAVHEEDWLGTIEVGKAADLALIDQDPEECSDLRDARVVLTILGGFLVHVDSEAFNEAVSRAAQRALEEALIEADLPNLDLDGPREEDEHDE